ncbi:MAG: hypothetical protein WBE76_26505 [Terracidiphilus sp.]
MSETPHRWYVVRYKSKEDATQGIDYDFGEKVQESVFFPTEQAAYAIHSLMRPWGDVYPRGRTEADHRRFWRRKG